MRFRNKAFWDYHRIGLAAIGRALSWRDILPWALHHLLRAALNPGHTIAKGLAIVRRERA